MGDIFIARSILFLEGFVFLINPCQIFSTILKTASENKSVWNWNLSFIPT